MRGEIKPKKSWKIATTNINNTKKEKGNKPRSVQFKSGSCYGELCGGGEVGEGGEEEETGNPAGVCARVCTCDGASDIACPSVTVRVVVDPPLVVSSASDPALTDRARIEGVGDGCDCAPDLCRSLSSDNDAELRERELPPLPLPPPCLANLARVEIAAAMAAVAAASDDDADADDRPGSLSSVRARAPARRGSKLPAPPTTGKPNVWLSGLLSAPSLPSTSDVLPRRTAPAARGDPGCVTRPKTSSMLDRDALPMPWIKLCVRARPSASDALDTETCELCRELALPEPEPELVFRDRERGRKAPLIRAREVALPLREPSKDALGLG